MKESQASAPGSFMMFGEHAVLRQYDAIVAALEKRISVTVLPRTDAYIEIHSALGFQRQKLSELVWQAPFASIYAIVATYQHLIPHGLAIIIESEMSCQKGFGTSAATIAATLAAVRASLGLDINNTHLFTEGLAVIKRVYGAGSGADLAASLHGGIGLFEPCTTHYTALDCPLALTLVYSGHKVTTPEVIAFVNNNESQQPEVYAQLFAALNTCVQQTRYAIKNKDWSALRQLIDVHHSLQLALQLSNTQLNEIIDSAKQCNEVIGAKISGSGLGDCVLVFGKLANDYFPNTAAQKQAGVCQHPIELAATGIQLGKKNY